MAGTNTLREQISMLVLLPGLIHFEALNNLEFRTVHILTCSCGSQICLCLVHRIPSVLDTKGRRSNTDGLIAFVSGLGELVHVAVEVTDCYALVGPTIPA